MTVESTVFAALTGLVNGRVFPDFTDTKPALPYIVYQQVGGDALNYLDPTVPDKKHSRMQISIWGADRASVSALAIQVENTMRTAPGFANVEGAPVSIYEADTKLRGSFQDFSFFL